MNTSSSSSSFTVATELPTAEQRADPRFVRALCERDHAHPAVRAMAARADEAPAEAYAEWLAHLPARGRVSGCGATGAPTVNPGGHVNGARLQSYDPLTRTVRVRVDDTHVPEFWLEIDVPLERLRAWVRAADVVEE